MSEKQASLKEGAYVEDAFSQLTAQQQQWGDKETDFEDKIQSMTEEISRLNRECTQSKETVVAVKAESEMTQDSLCTQLKLSKMQAVNLQKNLEESHNISVATLEGNAKHPFVMPCSSFVHEKERERKSPTYNNIIHITTAEIKILKTRIPVEKCIPVEKTADINTGNEENCLDVSNLTVEVNHTPGKSATTPRTPISSIQKERPHTPSQTLLNVR